MYPPEYAFLIQFSTEAASAAGQMTGRAEHLESGKTCQFTSLDELHRFLRQLLTAAATASPATHEGNSDG